MKHVESWEVHDALSDVVRERGREYVYKALERVERIDGSVTVPDCTNVERDSNGELQPSCIVGSVLHALGAPLAVLHCAPTDAFATFVYLRNNEVLQLPPTCTVALSAIQRAQDQGTSWGECLNLYSYVMDAYLQSEVSGY